MRIELLLLLLSPYLLLLLSQLSQLRKQLPLQRVLQLALLLVKDLLPLLQLPLPLHLFYYLPLLLLLLVLLLLDQLDLQLEDMKQLALGQTHQAIDL